jgi:hypothetical protein
MTARGDLRPSLSPAGNAAEINPDCDARGETVVRFALRGRSGKLAP